MGKPAVEIGGHITLKEIPTRKEAELIKRLIKTSTTPLVSTADWYEKIDFKPEPEPVKA